MPEARLRVPLIGSMPWRRFELAALVVPMGGVAFIVLYVLLSPWPHTHIGRVLLAGVLGLAGTCAFGILFLGAVRSARVELEGAVAAERRQRQQLDALHAAAIAITEDLDLTSVLGRVVDLSRAVIACRYAALRVLEADGPGAFLTSGIAPEEMAAMGPPPQGLGVLAVVADAQTSVRLERIQAHPASVGFPPNHPRMTTLLGTPVRFRERTFGYIYLSEKLDATPFTPDDERTLERFAAHAAAVIANAHLLAEVGRLGSLEERERIGRELHDGTLQELYAIALRLQAALPLEGEPALPPEARAIAAAVAGAVEALAQVMANIRRYVFGQGDGAPRPPVDLGPLLAGLVASLGSSERRPRITSALDLPAPFRVSPEAAHEIGQVVREALANAIRHGGASAISLLGAVAGGTLQLEGADDGSGFEASGGAAGHGLENMRLRASGLGGTLAVDTRPGAGTRVRLAVPLDRLRAHKE